MHLNAVIRFIDLRIFAGKPHTCSQTLTGNGNPWFSVFILCPNHAAIPGSLYGFARFSVKINGQFGTRTQPFFGKFGKPWITIACQGLGASVWFPCKDSQIDEPDNGVQMHYTCDSKLKCVSNGHFLGSEEHKNGTTTFSWEVKNPINNYNMIPYIGDYVNIHDHFQGEKGMLELDYWVLRGYEAQAEKQFMDAPRTLEALEYWFGPYAFYEDGYKLVHAPHLGMEHQSGIAYGNGFENGYLGTDLSGTGEGLK